MEVKRWKVRRIHIWIIFFSCLVVSLTSFVFMGWQWLSNEDALISFWLFISSSLMAFETWRTIRPQKAQKKLKKNEIRPSINKACPNIAVDLRNCDVGMSCREYSILAVVGPASAALPQSVRQRTEQHLNACGYHNSKTWHESALTTPVTETLKEAAEEIVKKYLAG